MYYLRLYPQIPHVTSRCYMSEYGIAKLLNYSCIDVCDYFRDFPICKQDKKIVNSKLSPVKFRLISYILVSFCNSEYLAFF